MGKAESLESGESAEDPVATFSAMLCHSHGLKSSAYTLLYRLSMLCICPRGFSQSVHTPRVLLGTLLCDCDLPDHFRSVCNFTRDGIKKPLHIHTHQVVHANFCAR